MGKKSASSHSYIFILCNSIFFFIGILGLFLQNIYILAVSVLLLSLTFLFSQLAQSQMQPDTETIEIPVIQNEDDDFNKMQMALKIQELTETNEQLCAKLAQLEEALQNAENKDTASSHFYDCPLATSIPYEINEFLQAYLHEKADILNHKQIQFTYSAEDDAHINLSAAAMNILLDDIFDNILKFTPTGGSLYIRVSLKSTDRLLLIFRNTCKPIQDSDADKIFDLNYQSLNHLLGTGLGLAQVKAIVTDFGGNVWTNNTNEYGFTLYLELPTYSVK